MDEDKYFELYLAVRSEQVEWMNRHGQNLRHYVTLVSAILVATVGAVYQFIGNPALPRLMALLGFGLNAALCIIAIGACNRSYQRFLEAVTITAKLESFLGLDGARPAPGDAREGKQPFERDASLLPKRWLESREEETAAKFVRHKMNRGANLRAKATMVILFAMNSALLLGVFRTCM